MEQFQPRYVPVFLRPPDDTYHCTKCCKILRPPVRQSVCGHRLCSLCVEAMFESHETANCPGNEEECVSLHKQELYPDFATSRELSRMVVKCRFCENGCDIMDEWRRISNHEDACPKNQGSGATASCAFSMAVQKLQSDQQETRRNVNSLSVQCDRIQSHVYAEIKSITEQLSSTQRLVKKLDRECKLLANKMKKSDAFQEEIFRHLVNGKCFQFNNYHDHKDRAIKGTCRYVQSVTFYTGSPGYKLCVRLHPNGYHDGEGTHLSISCVLLEGEYDTQLNWPFDKYLTFTIINQSSKTHHLSTTYICNPCNSCWGRPRSYIDAHEFGITRFAPHDQIEHGGFLKNDTLLLSIKFSDSISGMDRLQCSWMRI